MCEEAGGRGAQGRGRGAQAEGGASAGARRSRHRWRMVDAVGLEHCHFERIPHFRGEGKGVFEEERKDVT